ncbi:hypothetical protein ACSTS3_19670 [Aquimarina muelleri]|uniref:hypothetical protein n=1 Tax=Aquimarina muelleri TaxID=279356 RepID=UPI003F68641A
MPQTTIINKFGKLTGWNSITANMLNRDLEGVTELAYSDETDKKNFNGAGGFPVGRGDGNTEAKASISLYKEEVAGLLNALPSGGRLQDILPFDITINYEKADGSLQKDRIRNCEFLGNSIDVKNGDGSIVTKYDLLVSHIEWNVI